MTITYIGNKKVSRRKRKRRLKVQAKVERYNQARNSFNKASAWRGGE